MENILNRHQRIRNCPVCGQQVEGRLNKVYCGPNCKTLLNNNIAFEKRLQEKELTGGLFGNYRLLDRMLKENDDAPIVISRLKLEGMGFNSHAPATEGMSNGVLTYSFLDIAIQPEQANHTVKIFRLYL